MYNCVYVYLQDLMQATQLQYCTRRERIFSIITVLPYIITEQLITLLHFTTQASSVIIYYCIIPCITTPYIIRAERGIIISLSYHACLPFCARISMHTPTYIDLLCLTTLHVQQTRTKQSHQGQIVTARLGKLNLYSNQSSVSESSDSLQPQLLEPNAQVSLPSGSSKSLGMGLYGEVLEVVYKGYHYAAKEYRKDFICGNELKKKISEKLISLKLKHENIVIYCGVAHIRGTDRSVLVMEKVHKNLETVLEDRTRELQSATKISILSNIADGLNYLHSFGIIHCNLIPTNILLTRELKAKISDYGNALVRPIATTVTEGRQDTAVLNDYLPQEALDGGPCNEPSLDTFSFGHLSLYVILQQKPHPLKGYFFKQNGKRVARSEVERREDYLNQMKKNISGGLLEWIKQCLDDDPSLRPQLRKFNFSPNFISN